MNRPSVPEVLPLVRDYYAKPGNASGGSLHIVLDDGNIENHSVEFCMQWALGHHDPEGFALAQTLLQMSKTQRRKIYASHRG